MDEKNNNEIKITRWTWIFFCFVLIFISVLAGKNTRWDRGTLRQLNYRISSRFLIFLLFFLFSYCSIYLLLFYSFPPYFYLSSIFPAPPPSWILYLLLPSMMPNDESEMGSEIKKNGANENEKKKKIEHCPRSWMKWRTQPRSV